MCRFLCCLCLCARLCLPPELLTATWACDTQANGFTALMEAAYSNNSALTELLLNRGANVRQQDNVCHNAMATARYVLRSLFAKPILLVGGPILKGRSEEHTSELQSL